MEFLVDIEIRLPTDMPAATREDLYARELARGREMKASGAIVRIWRVPGRTANVGIWRVADTDALHKLLTTLPLFPYMDVRVRALGPHPIEASPESTSPSESP